MKLNFCNRNVCVTGGSHGIGRTIAIEFAKLGANVIICSRNSEKLLSVKNEIEKFGGKCEYVIFDALNEISILNAIDEIKEKFCDIDILVNNVGGGGRWGDKDIVVTNNQVWLEVFHKNVYVASLFIKSFITNMKEKGYGRVITISSKYGKEAGARPWFSIAKSGENALMKSLSKYKEYIRNGITFNTVSPGAIMISGTGWEKEKKENLNRFNEFIESLPLGRMGTPKEVANVVLFLASEYASLVNGANITVDGGESNAF